MPRPARRRRSFPSGWRRRWCRWFWQREGRAQCCTGTFSVLAILARLLSRSSRQAARSAAFFAIAAPFCSCGPGGDGIGAHQVQRLELGLGHARSTLMAYIDAALGGEGIIVFANFGGQKAWSRNSGSAGRSAAFSPRRSHAGPVDRGDAAAFMPVFLAALAMSAPPLRASSKALMMSIILPEAVCSARFWRIVSCTSASGCD